MDTTSNIQLPNAKTPFAGASNLPPPGDTSTFHGSSGATSANPDAARGTVALGVPGRLSSLLVPLLGVHGGMRRDAPAEETGIPLWLPDDMLALGSELAAPKPPLQPMSLSEGGSQFRTPGHELRRVFDPAVLGVDQRTDFVDI